MQIHLILVLLSLLVFIGCSQEKQKQVTPKATRDLGNIATLESADVLVKIGTNELTKADLDALADLKMRVASLSKSLGDGNGKINRGAFFTPIVATAQESFRAQTAMLTWAATNGVSAGETEIREFRKRFMLSCGRKEGKFADFLKNFSKKEQKTIKRRVRLEALMHAAQQKYLKEHPVVLTDKDVTDFIAKVTKYNQMASATNALVWAQATNLWQQAQNGADFGELADKYSQDNGKSVGGGWGQFRMADLMNDGKLDTTVAALKVGEISAPVEADNGLNVIKLLGIIDLHGNPCEATAPGARYDLARIFLELPEIYEIPSKEDTRKEMQQFEEKKALSSFVKGLMEHDGVVYPLGEKMFETARQQCRMPMMVTQEGVTDETLNQKRKVTFGEKPVK